MGNQLVAVAPSQILPVEHYLVPFELDLQYEANMGSTRFLKVVRAKSDEGPVVIKVFVRHDPSVLLDVHERRLAEIRKGLNGAINCLPFQRWFLTEKAGLIVRQYVKHSLYERIPTRPFLTVIEKKWITFQILYALYQCHKQKIYHGDIKLENIMLTSWNWILLTDFASFKPVYLPEDKPADYNYFFDTSRRRTCYIAPERFLKSPSVEKENEGLTPEMDIFSTGCALLELWTDGTAPFEYSQLLAYKNGDVDMATKHLQNIENKNLRGLLASMIHLDPKQRKAAEIYLDEERGRLFPEYFYSFLQSYVQMFSSTPIMPIDDKLTRLYSDIEQIIEILCDKDTSVTGDSVAKPEENTNGLILMTTVVTSCIRGIKRCNSKIFALEILHKLAQNTSSDIILDRILPYILYLTSDPLPRVRVCALDKLTECVSLVQRLPKSDWNIFPEYILPSISPLADDKSDIVRIAYARNIATLAETAVKFLQHQQQDFPDEMTSQRYEMELNALHEVLEQAIMYLLTDSQSIVKQTLIESGITKLCVFFGRQKANDIILSHMITFLNDKTDKNLRGSFFDCIVGVAGFVGTHCSPILAPLLEQGLTDPEEFVIAKAVRATTALTELDLIQKSGLVDFIKACGCYLNHPNLWIRHEVGGLISTAAKKLSPLDVQCKIMPSIVNHLKIQLIQVEKPELLLDCLQKPLPRTIYDAVLRFPEIEQFIDVIKQRKTIRDRVNQGQMPQQIEMSTSVKNLFRRLQNDGLDEIAEIQLLSMSKHLLKIHRYRSIEERKSDGAKVRQLDGRLKVAPGICLEVNLNDRQTKNDLMKRHRKTGSDASNLDTFTNIDSPSPTPSLPSNDSILASNNQPAMSLVDYSMPDRISVKEQIAECRGQLDGLIDELKGQYSVNSHDFTELSTSYQIPSKWKLKGTLIAHLHEHKSAVTRMTSLKPFSHLFTSISTDGTVRLWDCNKLDGQHSINRSRQIYSADTPLYAVAACESGQSIAVAGKDGTLLLLKLDPTSGKMALQQAKHLDTNSNGEGCVVDMMPLDQGSQNTIVYCTVYGSIVGWDIRMPEMAWQFENDLHKGVITTMCIDPTSSWLAVGTSSGWHICWDLRFRLPIHGKNGIKHPHDSRIRRITCHPTESSWLISSSQKNNEVFSWNIETQQRQTAFWASPAPALSNTTTSSHSVCAMLTGAVDKTPFLLTGGSDQRIRYWDFANSDNCAVVVPSPMDAINKSSITYDSRLIDGTRVIQELETKLSSTRKTEDSARSAPELPHPGHHDGITELLMCKTEKQVFVASSSRDGVVKLWK
ncbi:phosphoinositide 3-kinase regulatory subunit 4 [Culicoides brevitarsis]|uniref:phosphoinositide 3-kinase regulatory subunit 4 n=1 Tax=Culicoides brevitarsis TaxID=469753 RepID=UPI00307B419A